MKDTTTQNVAWERVSFIIERSRLSINAFARQIGLARGENLYQIKKGNNGISKALAKRICAHFPEISYEWLLCGDGEPNTQSSSNNDVFYFKEVPFSEVKAGEEYWVLSKRRQ